MKVNFKICTLKLAIGIFPLNLFLNHQAVVAVAKSCWGGVKVGETKNGLHSILKPNQTKNFFWDEHWL